MTKIKYPRWFKSWLLSPIFVDASQVSFLRSCYILPRHTQEQKENMLGILASAAITKFQKLGSLNNRNRISQFWRLQGQDQGASMIEMWWELSWWFTDGCLLTMSLHGRKRVRTNSLVSHLIWVSVPFWEPQFHDSI